MSYSTMWYSTSSITYKNSHGHYLNGQQPSIFRAIEGDDCQRLRQLIKSGHNIDKCDSNGLTALHLAADSGKEDCLQVLLESGAQLQTGPRGQTALHLAAQNGTKAMVDMLVDYGSVVDTKDFTGWTPLAAAVEVNNADIAMALLQRGAVLEPDVCVFALQNGFIQLFRDLLNFRPSIVGFIELNKFRFTRPTLTGLKILYFAGYPIDGTVVPRIRLLESSECRGDQDFDAFKTFANWHQNREDVMSLKCLSRMAFRKSCNGSLKAVFSEVMVPNVLKEYLLLNDIND